MHERMPSRLKMDLPENATAEQLEVLNAYIKQQQKVLTSRGYGTKNFYKEKHEILGSKLIIFLNSQKKSDIWYMRMHVGGKSPYKRLSLKTSDKTTAIARALDHWRNLQNHLDSGGSVFETKTGENIDKYIQYLDGLVETSQIKKHTVQCKKTSLKKLKEYLSAYEKPSDIPHNIFHEYTKWRRSKNWTRYHKNNTKPPSDLTINRELADFKGFFDWCSRENIITNSFDFPWIKYDPKKHQDSSPPFTAEDYESISYYIYRWYSDKELNKKWKNSFYRGVFMYYFSILAQSGMRPHEALKLRWSDVEIISEKKKIQCLVVDDDKDAPDPEEDEYGQTYMEIKNDDGSSDFDVYPKTSDLPFNWYFTSKSYNSMKEAVQLKRNWYEHELLGARIEVSPDTKTGRREIYCPAGFYFKKLWLHYEKHSPLKPSKNDYIFQNVGSRYSLEGKHVGNPLNDTFLRRLWYEFKEYLSTRMVLNPEYTLYSCRAFFINLNLEAGNKPHQVAKMVGHSVATQAKHYESMDIKRLATHFTGITSGQIKRAQLHSSSVDEI